MLKEILIQATNNSDFLGITHILFGQFFLLFKFRSNLPSTKNLTLLIKSQESKTKTKHHEDYLPVEVVAVGGKPGKQSERQPADLWPENYTYTSKINQVEECSIL